MRDFQLHFDVSPSKGDAVPLVLFPGLGLTAETLSPLLSKLTGPTLISVDPPGLGRSRLPTLPYTFKSLADYVAWRIHTLGYTRVDVFGYSWGGMLAQELALRHPRLVRKVILAATTMGMVAIPGNPVVPMIISNPFAANSKKKMMKVANLLNGGHVNNPGVLVPPRHASKGRAAAGHYYQILATSHWTSFPRIMRLDQPVLLLSGARDPLIPTVNTTFMKTCLPRVQTVNFESGHLFPVTEASDVARVISEFRSQPD